MNDFRSTSWDDFIGQDNAKLQIDLALKSAKIRNQPLEHTLLFGPAGIGKTTLAGIIAKQQDGELITASGTTLNTLDDLIKVIRQVSAGEDTNTLFVDEIHRLPKELCETLYTVMEDFEISFTVKEFNFFAQKKVSKYKEYSINPFTFIGATTQPGDIPLPMFTRFGLTINLQPYSVENLKLIIANCFKTMGLTIDSDAQESIAKRSRGVARTAIQYSQRVRDVAIVRHNVNHVNLEIVEETFMILEIDSMGLREQDYRYLNIIKSKPMGLNSLALNLGENESNIKNMIEPFLLSVGFVQFGTKGRFITETGLEYILNRS